MATAWRQLVGGTPVVRLRTLDIGGHRMWGKCEFVNPTGSVKDRIGAHILDCAAAAGVLTGCTTLVEATAGNTGIALAAAASRHGYRLVVTMSEKMGPDKVAAMRAVGAEVVICPYDVPSDSTESFINVARRLAGERPGAWFVDQFGTSWNRDAHEHGTGPELWAGLGGRLDAVVAGVGTGGTLMGVARYLRRQGAATAVVLADPAGSVLAGAVTGTPTPARPYLIEGIGGDFVPPLFESNLVDEVVVVPDAASVEMCMRVQRNEGLFLGGSSGCALAAAWDYARRLPPGAARDIAVLLPDGGGRYVSTIYDAAWRRAKGVDP
jgi:cystathionine beta-synthase